MSTLALESFSEQHSNVEKLEVLADERGDISATELDQVKFGEVTYREENESSLRIEELETQLADAEDRAAAAEAKILELVLQCEKEKDEMSQSLLEEENAIEELTVAKTQIESLTTRLATAERLASRSRSSGKTLPIHLNLVGFGTIRMSSIGKKVEIVESKTTTAVFEFAVDCAAEAYDSTKFLDERTQFVQRRMETQFGGIWGCIVHSATSLLEANVDHVRKTHFMEFVLEEKSASVRGWYFKIWDV